MRRVLLHQGAARRLLATVVLFLLASAPPSVAATNFPEKITARDLPLERMGQARCVYRLFFDLYDAALYTTPGATPEDVLAYRVPVKLQFHYLREIERGIILRSADRMLEKNLTGEEYARIAERVERIDAAYTTVGPGDTSALAFKPGAGTTLFINGEEKTNIPGDDFARLYFRIWLGEKPINRDLKRGLLSE